MAADNPYLAHSQNGALDGFRARAATGKQVEAAMDHPTNPFTGRQYSTQYREILAKRKALPVFKQVKSTPPAESPPLPSPVVPSFRFPLFAHPKSSVYERFFFDVVWLIVMILFDDQTTSIRASTFFLCLLKIITWTLLDARILPNVQS